MDTRTTTFPPCSNATTVEFDNCHLRNRDFASQNGPPLFLLGIQKIVTCIQTNAFNRVRRNFQTDNTVHDDRSPFEGSRFAIENDDLPFEAGS